VAEAEADNDVGVETEGGVGVVHEEPHGEDVGECERRCELCTESAEQEVEVEVDVEGEDGQGDGDGVVRTGEANGRLSEVDW